VLAILFFSTFSQAFSSLPPAAFSSPRVFAAWAAVSGAPELALRLLAEECAVVDARPQVVSGAGRVEMEPDGLSLPVDEPSLDAREQAAADWPAELARDEYSAARPADDSSPVELALERVRADWLLAPEPDDLPVALGQAGSARRDAHSPPEAFPGDWLEAQLLVERVAQRWQEDGQWSP